MVTGKEKASAKTPAKAPVKAATAKAAPAEKAPAKKTAVSKAAVKTVEPKAKKEVAPVSSVVTKKASQTIPTKKSGDKGSFEFKVYSPASSSVSVAGNFNEWNPEKGKMKKTNDGYWSFSVTLPAGDYEYKYVYDGSSWEVDPSAPSKLGDHGLNNIVRIS